MGGGRAAGADHYDGGGGGGEGGGGGGDDEDGAAGAAAGANWPHRATSVAAAFWDIPAEELVLQKCVAAGGGGTVWKATYRHRTVAAKQLTAMSDLVGLDEALLELVNEVCVRVRV
jgi:hypothetical protein